MLFASTWKGSKSIVRKCLQVHSKVQVLVNYLQSNWDQNRQALGNKWKKSLIFYLFSSFVLVSVFFMVTDYYQLLVSQNNMNDSKREWQPFVKGWTSFCYRRLYGLRTAVKCQMINLLTQPMAMNQQVKVWSLV